jgi:hypothetical protein
MARRDNGGIGGSGVFGLLGTTVNCDAQDRSLYCTAAKVMNMLMWLAILYGLFILAREYIAKKK